MRVGDIGVKKERFSVIPAVYLFLIRENQVLLLLRENTGYEDNKYSTIAGHVEAGETTVEALIREAKEEAGITIKEDDFSMGNVMYRKSDSERVDFFFVSSSWQGEITNVEPNKCGGLNWFPIDNLPENTIDFVKVALGNSLNGISFCEYGW